MKTDGPAAKAAEVGPTGPSANGGAAEPRNWGWPWDVLALAVPLIAALPGVRFEWDAFWGRQDRWLGAGVISLVLLGSILSHFLGRRSTKQLDGASAKSEITRSRGLAAVGLLLFSAVCCLLAAIWVAPWLGAFAAVVSLVAWALGRFPELSGVTILAWGGLLLFALPLPGRWDVQFPATLQQTAGYLSGGFLDLLGVPNLRFANSLEVRELNFTFALAGRGPFAFWGLAGLVAAAVFLRRPPLLSAVVSLGFLPLLGLALYFQRYVGLAYLQHAWGINALLGTNFLWLCLGCLGIVFVGWLLLDLLLRFLLDAVSPDEPELAPFYAKLNRVLCWPQEPPFDLPEEFEAEKVERLPGPPAHWYQSRLLRIGTFIALGLSLFAGVVSFAVQAQVGSRSVNGSEPPRYSAERLRDFPGREVLPETIDGWQRTEFVTPLDETEAEAEAATTGPVEFCWTYLAGKKNFDLRLQMPFVGEPNPVLAFERQGWEVTEIRVQRDPDGLDSAWLELFLRNSFGGRAWVCLSSFDSVGRPYTEWTELARFLPNRPGMLATFKRMVGEIPPLTMQVQLYCDSVDVKNKPELARLRRVYVQLRQKLLDDRTQRNWSLGN